MSIDEVTLLRRIVGGRSLADCSAADRQNFTACIEAVGNSSDWIDCGFDVRPGLIAEALLALSEATSTAQAELIIRAAADPLPGSISAEGVYRDHLLARYLMTRMAGMEARLKHRDAHAASEAGWAVKWRGASTLQKVTSALLYATRCSPLVIIADKRQAGLNCSSEFVRSTIAKLSGVGTAFGDLCSYAARASSEVS